MNRQEFATKGAIRIEHVDKVYHAREGEVQAVADCSLDRVKNDSSLINIAMLTVISSECKTVRCQRP